MEFASWLTTMWNTPAVDLSGTVVTEEFINLSKSEIFTINQNNKSSIKNEIVTALEESAKLKAAENAGLSNLTFSENKVLSDGDPYSVNFNYGIPSVMSLDTKVPKKPFNELTFDDTDNMDYKNRFISIDAPNRSNDAADIAFFRIVKANDLKTVVFPNYDQYQAPGLSKNKFRQFILLSIQEASQERMQVVETSDEFQLLFYGKKPEIIQISGILKNTLDNPWNMNMLFLWDNFMRGTKLAEQGNILQLYADRDLYSGYPFGFQRSKAAPNDFIVNFSFSFIIIDRLSSEDITIKYDDISGEV